MLLPFGLLFFLLGFKVEGLAIFALLLLGFPEIAFACFSFAGLFKADPRLPQFPVDLTLLFGMLTVMGLVLCHVSKGAEGVIEPLKKGRGLFFGYLLVTLVLFVGVVYTPSPAYGLDKVLRFATITALGCFAPLLLFQNVRSINLFFYAVLAIASAACIQSFVTDPVGKDPWQYASAFGAEYLAVGRAAGFAAIAAIALMFSFPGRLSRFVLLVPVFGLNMYGLFFSAARGPFVAFSSALVLPWLYQLLTARRKARAMVATASVALFFVLFFSVFHNHFYMFSARMDGLSDAKSTREALLDLSMESVRSSFSTALIGVGTGGFRRLAGYGDDQLGKVDVYTHNVFAEYLCENGMVGLSAFLVLLFIVAKKALSLLGDHGRDSPWIVWICSLVLFTLINALFSGDSNGNRELFTCFGIVYAIDNISRQQTA
jgi:O-antigen ligase